MIGQVIGRRGGQDHVGPRAAECLDDAAVRKRVVTELTYFRPRDSKAYPPFFRALLHDPPRLSLDEPAAGLPDEETEHLSSVIRQIPGHSGALTILVDHDMSLVSGCCETTAVLDFGKLISAGPTEEVLHDERVVRAYLGTEENV